MKLTRTQTGVLTGGLLGLLVIMFWPEEEDQTPCLMVNGTDTTFYCEEDACRTEETIFGMTTTDIHRGDFLLPAGTQLRGYSRKACTPTCEVEWFLAILPRTDEQIMALSGQSLQEQLRPLPELQAVGITVGQGDRGRCLLPGK